MTSFWFFSFLFFLALFSKKINFLEIPTIFLFLSSQISQQFFIFYCHWIFSLNLIHRESPRNFHKNYFLLKILNKIEEILSKIFQVFALLLSVIKMCKQKFNFYFFSGERAIELQYQRPFSDCQNKSVQRYTTRPDLNDLFTPLPIYFLSFILRYLYMPWNAHSHNISTHRSGDFCASWENQLVEATPDRKLYISIGWIVMSVVCARLLALMYDIRRFFSFALGLEYIVLWLLAKTGPPLWGLKWWYGYGTSQTQWNFWNSHIHPDTANDF